MTRQGVVASDHRYRQLNKKPILGREFHVDVSNHPKVWAVGVSALSSWCALGIPVTWLARNFLSISWYFPYLLPLLSSLCPHRGRPGETARKGEGSRSEVPTPMGRERKHVKMNSCDRYWCGYLSRLPLLSTNHHLSLQSPFPNGSRYSRRRWSRRSLCRPHSPRARCKCHPPRQTTVGLSLHLSDITFSLSSAPRFMGGNSTKATSGINGAGTQSQQDLGIQDSARIFFDDTKKSVRVSHPCVAYSPLNPFTGS